MHDGTAALMRLLSTPSEAQHGEWTASAGSRGRVRSDTAPDFLGGAWAQMLCDNCGASTRIGVETREDEVRVHYLDGVSIAQASGDLLGAFAQSLSSRIDAVAGVGEAPHCHRCRNRSGARVSWFGPESLTDAAPRLLALTWHSSRSATTWDGRAQRNSREPWFDVERRDAAVLRTQHGEATFTLVALVMYNGYHFITVGRTLPPLASDGTVLRSSPSHEWMCWDGLRPCCGQGVVLRDAPVGHGELRARSGPKSWSNYKAHMAIYCRTAAAAPATANAATGGQGGAGQAADALATHTVSQAMVTAVEDAITHYMAGHDEELTFHALSEQLQIRTDSSQWPEVLRAVEACLSEHEGVICRTSSGIAVVAPGMGVVQTTRKQ